MSKVAAGKARIIKRTTERIVHTTKLKTNIPAGMAAAGPPLGPMLGQVTQLSFFPHSLPYNKFWFLVSWLEIYQHYNILQGFQCSHCWNEGGCAVTVPHHSEQWSKLQFDNPFSARNLPAQASRWHPESRHVSWQRDSRQNQFKTSVWDCSNQNTRPAKWSANNEGSFQIFIIYQRIWCFTLTDVKTFAFLILITSIVFPFAGNVQHVDWYSPKLWNSGGA